MSVSIEKGRAVITPTARNWYAGAAVMVVLSFAVGAPWGLLAAAFLALTGTGALNRIVLDTQGFEYRNYWVTKRYAWSEVSDFGVRVYRANFFAATKLVTFNEVARKETLYGKFSRAVAGGTQSMPVVGIEPGKLLELIGIYSAHGAHVETAEKPKAAPRPKPAFNMPSPAYAGQPAARAKAPAQRPIELIVDSRTRARQTKGWPNA
jgi:hypothetical protein